MFVSPISFNGVSKVSVKKVSEPLKKAVNEIPSETELLNKIAKYWKMVDEDPLNITAFNKFCSSLEVLKKHYPKAYKEFDAKYKLH